MGLHHSSFQGFLCHAYHVQLERVGFGLLKAGERWLFSSLMAFNFLLFSPFIWVLSLVFDHCGCVGNLWLWFLFFGFFVAHFVFLACQYTSLVLISVFFFFLLIQVMTIKIYIYTYMLVSCVHILPDSLNLCIFGMTHFVFSQWT